MSLVEIVISHVQLLFPPDDVHNCVGMRLITNAPKQKGCKRFTVFNVVLYWEVMHSLKSWWHHSNVYKSSLQYILISLFILWSRLLRFNTFIMTLIMSSKILLQKNKPITFSVMHSRTTVCGIHGISANENDCFQFYWLKMKLLLLGFFSFYFSKEWFCCWVAYVVLLLPVASIT